MYFLSSVIVLASHAGILCSPAPKLEWFTTNHDLRKTPGNANSFIPCADTSLCGLELAVKEKDCLVCPSGYVGGGCPQQMCAKGLAAVCEMVLLPLTPCTLAPSPVDVERHSSIARNKTTITSVAKSNAPVPAPQSNTPAPQSNTPAPQSNSPSAAVPQSNSPSAAVPQSNSPSSSPESQEMATLEILDKIWGKLQKQQDQNLQKQQDQK